MTAPEISDLFGRCVARQCAQVLRGGGEILELGAGSGRMASVILRSLAAVGKLPERYSILEVSADLAERQRERLGKLPHELRGRVVWLERLPERPIEGVILANEVLDALPCRRFALRSGVIRELGVTVAGGGPAEEAAVQLQGGLRKGFDEPAALLEREAGPDDELASACAALLDELPAPLPDGYSSEVCLRVAPWLAGVAECLGRGVMLFFDYGLPRAHYYHPQRTEGTLRCHFKQRVHDDPYVNIGVQDITAWVDFTRVAEAAIACGLEVAGFCTQAGFLLATGVERLVAASADPIEHVRLAGEARRLLLPAEMGEAIKAMALARNYDDALEGFALQDLRQSL